MNFLAKDKPGAKKADYRNDAIKFDDCFFGFILCFSGAVLHPQNDIAKAYSDEAIQEGQVEKAGSTALNFSTDLKVIFIPITHQTKKAEKE